MKSTGRIFSVLFIFLSFTACQEDDNNTPGPGEAGPGTFFVIQTTVESPEGRTSFVQLKENLDFEALSLDSAIELPGNARVFLSEHNPSAIFVGGGETAQIQKYEITEGGTLTPGTTVSFANFGLTYVPFGNNFVSKEKAYLVFGEGGQILIWNPTSMEVVGEIPLDDPRLQKGYTISIDPGVVRDDGRAFFLVQQQDFGDPTSDGLFAGMQVLVVNTQTDRIEAVIEDPRRVGGFSGLTQMDDGTIYTMGDNYTVRGAIDPSLPGSGVLRILPGEVAFDDDYDLPTSTAVGQESCGGLEVISGTQALISCWDLPEVSADLTQNPFALFDEQIATWQIIDLAGEQESIALTEIGKQIVGTAPSFSVDGKTYVVVGGGRSGNNQLFNLTAEGVITPLFTTEGIVSNLGKVQPN